MAIDISLANNTGLIKNGTVIVNGKILKNGVLVYNTYDAIVTNNPTISEIENKYDNLFDDPSYYYGGGNGTNNSIDGGNVGDVVVGG